MSQQAARDLDQLPDTVGRRIYASLRALGGNPRPVGCKKLKGRADTYRMRVGDYRALYDVDDTARTVLVLRVQHRKDVYRSL